MKRCLVFFSLCFLLAIPAPAFAGGHCDCSVEKFDNDDPDIVIGGRSIYIIRVDGDKECYILVGWCEPGCFAEHPPIEIDDDAIETPVDGPKKKYDGTIQSIQLPCIF